MTKFFYSQVGLIAGLALVVVMPVWGCNSDKSKVDEKTKPEVEKVASPVTAQAVPIKKAPKFGPLLGKSLKLSVPAAGIWAGSYDYGQSKYPTREIYIGKSVQGRSLLTLEKDQSASGCFAVFFKDYYSKSRYASRDGKDHTTDEKKRWLLGIKGKWTPGPQGVIVELDTKDPKACRTEKNNSQHDLPVKLACMAIEKNDRLPVAGLLCKIERAPYWIENNGLDLGLSDRAGAWVLRQDPSLRSLQGPAEGNGPWLLFGARPGLLVESRDERRDKSPRVSFKKEKVVLIPRNYLPRPPKP
jgi:hypothetical protein